MDFNKLNSELHQLSAPHRFSKKPDDFDRGYMKISNWLNGLCYYYEQKRKADELSDENEFQNLIDDYISKINELEASDYKNGLLKAINEI